eukprot:CAMPEP_0179917048 /NCGR_PEP_ID=MMETSP0983-20121128/2599_1 /TAXON_ID=483367 /ORGANISM="non described non described, Strain CCMP 2436" /LENGTH=94 /DNA_ID=CAMNT_0021819705 /DNA_START=162 /DNA_END=447 /DNA_ORIENTATION=-
MARGARVQAEQPVPCVIEAGIAVVALAFEARLRETSLRGCDLSEGGARHGRRFAPLGDDAACLLLHREIAVIGSRIRVPMADRERKEGARALGE